MIKVIVSGTGSLIGQAIIKSINVSKFKNDVELLGLDYFQKTVGSYWCKKNFILPDIYQDKSLKNEWVKAISKIISDEGVKFIFIGVDFELPLFAEYKDVFENLGCKVLINSKEVIEISDDKYLTYKFLKDNGLTYPKTFKLEVGQSECPIEFPVIVKPAVGARSRDVYVVKDTHKLKELSLQSKGFIIQELIGDAQSEYTCGVLVLDGKFISSIPLRRDLKDGNTFKAYYDINDNNPIIEKYIKELALKLKVNGACNFQLRLDGDDIPKLFEINSRHSGTTYMRTFFGYNEIEMILTYYLEDHITKPELKEGMVIRYFTEEFFESEKKLK